MSVPKLLLPPTLLTASSVAYAATETLFLRSLLAAPPDVAGNALFQWLWRGLLPGGIGLAVLTSGGGAATGAWAWSHMVKGTMARWYVGWGSIAAGMHLVWSPAVSLKFLFLCFGFWSAVFGLWNCKREVKKYWCYSQVCAPFRLLRL